MDAIVQNMFEINYSQLMQYEILEKLVTYMNNFSNGFQSVLYKMNKSYFSSFCKIDS